MEKGLRAVNEQRKLAEWAARISDCRNSGQSVQAWCKENGVCSQTYYRWQRRLFEAAKAQREIQFAEVTPQTASSLPGEIAVTIRIGEMEAAIHSGADSATVAAVLQILKSC